MSSEERVRYRDATVPWTTQVVDRVSVGERLVHVTMSTPDNYRPTVLDTIAVDVSLDKGPDHDTMLRRYTVSAVSDSTFDIVAFRTERGPATAFLDALAAGATISGQGPERPVKTPDSGSAKTIVVGDETAFGTIRAVAELASAPVVSCVMSVLDLSDVSRAFPGVDLTVVTDETALLEWLTAEVGKGDPSATGVWVVGEQSVNHVVRTRAKELGVGKDAVATRTFWRPDRAGIE